MPKSLYIDCQRIEEPAATDPLERRTWAEFRLYVKDMCVTDFWNRHTESLSKTIYVPTFPIADWIVANWWSLLHEPSRSERPPAENIEWDQSTWEWLSRHCLRTSESSLFLPFLHLFSNGDAVSVTWSPDDWDAPTHMPGYFVNSGSWLLDRREVEAGLREFVAKVLHWCDDINDIRVEQLKNNWAAITNADREEQAFCQAAGCMGLDPYALDQWPAGVADFITKIVGDCVPEGIANDFFEATEAESAPALWSWIDDTQKEFNLSGKHSVIPERPVRFGSAKDMGYSLAQSIRQQARLPESDPIADLENFTQERLGLSLQKVNHNHVPSRRVNAIVGWDNPDTAIVAGPEVLRPDSSRFLLARGLYHALMGCSSGARLLTGAYTWEQQASRAFAAELLAPKKALAAEVGSDMDDAECVQILERLAEDYNVSTLVVQRQLENQGVWG